MILENDSQNKFTKWDSQKNSQYDSQKWFTKWLSQNSFTTHRNVSKN